MEDSEIGRAVRQLTEAWLEWSDTVDRLERSDEITRRVEGHRVVDGGQIDSDGSWEIKDAETGELLAQGVGPTSYSEAWEPSWFHVDAIGEAAFDDTARPQGHFGLPPQLAQTISDWVLDQPGEARQLLGKN